MSSRALYRLGRVIEACAWLLCATIFLAVYMLDDDTNWVFGLATFGLAAWASFRLSVALDLLKAEANRDTRLGLNGPARQEDLL